MVPETNVKILLVEDETNVGSTLADRLDREGFGIHWAQSCKEAERALGAGPFALALLDVNLPDGTGFEIARFIRQNRPGMAVMFLTAAGTPEDRIHGLELGAEDYVVKPFHTKELLLRIQNVLKRAQFVNDYRSTGHPIAIGEALVSFADYTVELRGIKHPLSHKECALLKLLIEKRGHVVSRDEILDLVWSEDEYPTPRTVDNFILRLRRVLEPNSDRPSPIRSVRGVGYVLEKENP